MKTIQFLPMLILSLILFRSQTLQAQNPEGSKLPTLAVLTFRNEYPDPKAINFSPTDLIRIELEKKKMYQVLDRYDMEYLLNQQKLESPGCMSRFCLEDVGKKINVDRILVGNLSLINDRISISLKIFNPSTGQFEKNQTSDFLNIPAEVGNMIIMTVNELAGIPNEPLMLNKLTRKHEFANSYNNPDQLYLNCEGPRMGFASLIFEPSTYKIMKDKKANGGFDAGFPLIFQFGYQFEKQYLNEGNFQALFEFVPMLTGLDQGLMIPSFTVMNGIRNNTSGWEFAFGPTVSLMRKAKGYYDANGNWVYLDKNNTAPFGSISEERLDRRGDPALKTGFIIAAGKTFKSGKLNIPVNLYIIPRSDGFQTGISFGFNSKARTL